MGWTQRDTDWTYCPLLNALLTECYCWEMPNAHMEQALQFCGGEYHCCIIFQKLSSGDDATAVGAE